MIFFGYNMCISITNNLILEIAELRLAVSDLAREVRELRYEKEVSRTRTQHSLFPSPLPTNSSKVRKTLEPMNHGYRKAFRVSISYYIVNIFNYYLIII